jgi:hypothetical protein
MQKLTGLQRYQLTRLWRKGDKEISKEEYIKKVCKLKGIEYVAPAERKFTREV